MHVMLHLASGADALQLHLADVRDEGQECLNALPQVLPAIAKLNPLGVLQVPERDHAL